MPISGLRPANGFYCQDEAGVAEGLSARVSREKMKSILIVEKYILVDKSVAREWTRIVHSSQISKAFLIYGYKFSAW